MANNVKTNPIGIDARLHKIQTKLYDKLTAKWGVSLEGYPRCYTIDREGVKTIEHFIKGNEYSGNLIVAEKSKFFFVAENDHSKQDNLLYQTDVSLYFIVDVREIYPEIAHRCDNEVLADVLLVLSRCPGLLVKRTVVVEFKKVFQGYNVEGEKNMQPYYCFRINFTLSPYAINEKLC
jgi:hypothetical protein